MTAPAEWAFTDALAALASPGSPPAAGTATAWTLAVAAALIEFAVPAARDAESAAMVERARALRRHALCLGDQDLSAVAVLLGNPDEASIDIQAVPRALVVSGAEVVELAAAARERVSGPASADLKAAAILAAASCSAAAELVAANHRGAA